jgi:hypothetical protein
MDRFNLLKDFFSKENGVYVEIGTWTGEFAEALLTHNATAKLYCIDPYERYEGYNDSMNLTVGDDQYNEAVAKLSQFGDRVVHVKQLSSNAVSSIPDNIDGLYIDANHGYKYVKADLETYYSKVAPGGYVVGHNADDTDDSRRNEDGDIVSNFSANGVALYHAIGVLKAFREFESLNGLFVNRIKNQAYFQKPVPVVVPAAEPAADPAPGTEPAAAPASE